MRALRPARSICRRPPQRISTPVATSAAFHTTLPPAQNGVDDQRTAGSDDKTQTINSGDGGELQQAQVAAGGVPAEIPGKAAKDQVGAGDIPAPPKEKAPASRRTPVLTADELCLETSATAQPKTAGKRAKTTLSKAQNSGGGQRIDIAVLMHHRVDPRNGKRVENDSVKPAVEQSLRERALRNEARISMANGEPSEQRQIVIGKRKRQGRAAREWRAATAVYQGKFIQCLMIALKPARSSAARACFGGALIGIRTDLHTIKLIAGGRHNERRELFALERVRHRQARHSGA